MEYVDADMILPEMEIWTTELSESTKRNIKIILSQMAQGRTFSPEKMALWAKAFTVPNPDFFPNWVDKCLTFEKIIFILVNHPFQTGWPILADLLVKGFIKKYEWRQSGVQWAFASQELYNKFKETYPEASQCIPLPQEILLFEEFDVLY